MGKWVKYTSPYWARIQIGPMGCSLSFHNNYIYLSSLGSTNHKDHKQGYGTRVLKLAKRIAKKLNLPIQLDVSPYRMEGAIPLEKLFEFYYRNGFKGVRHHKHLLEYTP